MKNSKPGHPLQALVLAGIVSQEALDDVIRSAPGLERPESALLVHELGTGRPQLLTALSAYYQCPAIEYDERLPVPPELLTAVNPEALARGGGWFPAIKNLNGSLVIAAADPSHPELPAAVASCLGPGRYEYRVTLADDLQCFGLDFLHAPPGELIGTERTGLAFWRNTMAQWRTLLACYRTDMATGRTALAFTRTGLATITIAMTLISSPKFHISLGMAILMIFLGTLMSGFSLPVYLKVRRYRMRPPKNHTLVEVTAATLLFLENYHFIAEAHQPEGHSKETMLARLGDFLANHSTILYPSPASRERTHLARERNVLAAQRTIAACYRTIYARARTGLALTRTGVAFITIGTGLLSYFGRHPASIFDCLLIVCGFLMVVDGIMWYMPFRKEQAELPQTRSEVLGQQPT